MSGINSSEQKAGLSRPVLEKLAVRLAIVSAVFAVLLAFLMIANFLQTRAHDPLNSAVLARLMQQLQENPEDNELKEQIRALDLLARKAYFTHQWQIRTGAILLFVSVLLCVASLKYLRSGAKSLPDFAGEPAAVDFLSRRILLYSGLALFLAAFAAALLSENELRGGMAAAADYPSVEQLRDNWPTFRGPEGNGHAYADDVPLTWDGGSGGNIRWKLELPLPGFNSPVLWEERLFLSGADEENQQIYCIDAASGEMVWTAAVDDIPGHPAEAPNVTDDTGYAAPTLATDGVRVYALFATGDLAALDFNGRRLWAKNLGDPDNHYGHSSSLFTYKDLLLVQYDTGSDKQLLAFRSATGAPVYTAQRPDVQISWASPLLILSGARDQVVLSSTPYVISYDPASGAELWRVKCMDGEVAPSPAYAGDQVFVVNEYARLAAIRFNGSAEIVWEYEDELSEVASPLAAGELLFQATSYGTVSCFSAETGEVLWSHEFDEGFYSSPMFAGGRIYLMDMDGVTHVFSAADEFELLAKNELGEDAMTIPAFMNNRIYIRGVKHLFCIGK